MTRALGIDSSNYTTSVCLYEAESGRTAQKRKPLPVKAGEKGLRQSEAVFHHVKALGELTRELFKENGAGADAIGVSEKPRDVEGSYMPCFLVGINAAVCVGAATGKPVYRFSHQAGHVMSALYSAGCEELINEKFIAFHISGGTSEVLLAVPDDEKIFSLHIIGGTSDLNCGQAIDRTGLALGLTFPCGPQLERLALKSEKKFSPRVHIKDGKFSFSGLENQCGRAIDEGASPEDAARYCLEFVSATLEKAAEYAVKKFGELPIICAGGVMSDSIIAERLKRKFGAKFAAPEFARDNAAGVAVLASIKRRRALG